MGNSYIMVKLFRETFKGKDLQFIIKYGRLYHGLRGDNTEYAESDFKDDLKTLCIPSNIIDKIFTPDNFKYITRFRMAFLSMEKEIYRELE